MLAVAAAVTACTKEGSSSLPSVSFASAIPVTADGAATFTVSVENYTGTDAVTVPVEFSGDAQKDVDYTVSAEAFVIGGASPVTTITVTPLVYGSDKKVTVTIVPPAGFAAGKYVSSTFTLSDRLGRFTFINSTATMTSKVTVSANIYDDSDNRLTLQNGDEIPVTVNTEQSTAVEGVNFKFADDKKAVVFPAGSNTGTVTLEFMGDAVDEEANTIVLDFVSSNGKYGSGQYVEVTITIIGPIWNSLDGKWQINELITTKDYMTETWWIDDPTQLDGFPVFNENDMFVINTSTDTFTPMFESEFKNYFIGESHMTAEEEYSLRTGMSESAELQLFNLDNTNRNFSATSESSDKNSYIGLRLITDDETNEQLLDMYLIDCHPTDFLTIFDEYFCYNDNRPVLTMTGCFIQATFKKVE